jgi:DUF4097 and DUF4098 domain-containing protein YvlB
MIVAPCLIFKSANKREIKMKRTLIYFPIFLLAVFLGTSFAGSAWAQNRESLSEEFDQTYPLSRTGRVSLENINGDVTIGVWDRNEVRVRATKRASTRARLDEARVTVTADAECVRIKTEYEPGERNNVASVEYVISVPRTARLDRIAIINGDVNIENVTGTINAATINGTLVARGLDGGARLSTINGRIEATFNALRETSETAVESINGSINLIIPSDANATVRARVHQGSISNDFNIPVRRGRFYGTSLSARLGAGAARLNINNLHGAISLRRAADNRPLAPVTNLLPQTSEEDEDDDDNDVEVEADSTAGRATARVVTREAARAQRESERAARATARATAREVEHAVNRAVRDVERATADLPHEATGRRGRIIEREQRNFTTTGTPRLRLETFDGSILVRTWDRSEVGVTISKRGSSQEEVQAVRVTIEQRGDEIIVNAAYNQPATGRAGGINNYAAADFQINVPREANVRAATGDGRILIQGVSGELILNSSDGSVEIHGGRGRVRAATSDGQIRVINFTGEADARTSDGSIALDGNFTQLSAQTGDGAITLALPVNANATIETRAESVINDGLATAENANEAERTRRWRVGSGGASVFTLRTGDGHIILRRRNAVSQ